MFGLGIPELLLIFALALILVGPEKLPELARNLGRMIGSVRHAADEIRDDISFEINLDEEKKTLDEHYKKLGEESDNTGKSDEDIN